MQREEKETKLRATGTVDRILVHVQDDYTRNGSHHLIHATNAARVLKWRGSVNIRKPLKSEFANFINSFRLERSDSPPCSVVMCCRLLIYTNSNDTIKVLSAVYSTGSECCFGAVQFCTAASSGATAATTDSDAGVSRH